MDIQICYEIITPESAEYGEAADHGFYGPGGWTFSITDDEFNALADRVGHTEAVKQMTPEPSVFGSVEDVINFLNQYGPFEASSHPVIHYRGIWLIQSSPSVDYATGEEIRLSFHFDKFTEEQMKEILESVLEN